MGLSLNNIYQRPYIKPDERRPVRKRDEEEKSSATGAKKEGETGQNSKSNGLNYVEQKAPSYTPAYEQKFALPPQNAYNNVNINISPNRNTQASNISGAETAVSPDLNNKINIAQILKDFKNTAIAIGTPEDLSEIVNGYLAVVQKQAQTGKADTKLIKNTLNSAASILDGYISETLKKDSKVVENWVDALFLQNIDLNYNEESINERFLVKFPDGSTSQTTRQNELEATAQEQENQNFGETSNVIPITVAGQNINKIPQDKQLKSLFIQAKKYAYANNPEQAIKLFEQALNRALEIDDTETSGKIYYEVGKIYDNHDYVAQALKSYHQSIQLTTDENVKTKAHYSMAQIYDDVNQIKPAIDHYFSTVSHAGEADNLPAQSASLTKLGNIYTDMYEKQAFEYYDTARDLANETDNAQLKGFVDSNTGKAYKKFDEPEKALKSYSNAVKNYTDADVPLKTAQNYLASADIMVEYNAINKALNLLNKAQKYARQTDDVNLMNEINTKIRQLQTLN
ncbi:MAG: tetratricopeptide repeat protein [Candidatus Gastranaerophilaceae bacterium]